LIKEEKEEQVFVYSIVVIIISPDIGHTDGQ